MTFGENLKPKNAWLSTVLALGVIAYVILRFSPFAIDDSYIHLRIARNWVDHGQPYFNLNERVMGAAPHLWIALLAILLRLTGNVDFLPILEIFFVFTAYICTCKLLETRYSEPWNFLLALALVLLFLTGAAAGSMETALALSVFLASAVEFRNENFRRLGLCCGLNLWIRPEFLFAAVLAVILIPSASARKRFLIGFLPALSAGLGFTLYCYGTVIPFPAIAKHYVYAVSISDNLFYVSAFDEALNWPTRLWTLFQVSWAASAGVLTVVLALIFTVISLTREALRSPRWIQFLFGTGFGIYLTYVFIHRSLLFSWYVPHFMLPIGLALTLLLRRRMWAPQVLAAAIAFPVEFEMGLRTVYAAVTNQIQYQENFEPYWRVEALGQIGRELQALAPDKIVMAPEIGGLGWAFKGNIVDAGALVTPAMLPYYSRRPLDRNTQLMQRLQIDPEAVLHFAPDYLVSLNEWTVQIDKAISERRLEGYELWKAVPIFPPSIARQLDKTELWHSTAIHVYRRKDAKIVL